MLKIRARFRAITVVDADISVGTRITRRMQRHQLIASGAERLRRNARLRRPDRARLPTQVHHHDLVAEAVHLGKEMIGKRAHEALSPGI